MIRKLLCEVTVDDQHHTEDELSDEDVLLMLIQSVMIAFQDGLPNGPITDIELGLEPKE